MKILIVTPIFPPRTGGPATYVWELSKRLKKKHKIKIICFSPKAKSQNGIEIMALSEKGNIFSRQLILFKNVFQKAGWANVIYIQGPLVVGLTATIASRLRRKRVMLKFVGDEVWEADQLYSDKKIHLEDFYKLPLSMANNLKRWCQRLSFYLASQIIVPSQYLNKFLIKYHKLQTNKINIINNAVEIKRLEIQTKQKNTIIYVGRLVPWKNIDQIIKAIKKARKIKHWKLTIIGEGPEELKLRKLVKKLKAEKWVLFKGRLTHKETLNNIAKSEKLILYSSYEGLPHTLIEAMLLKTTIMASDIQANKEVLHDYGTLVPLENIEALTKAINQNIKYQLTDARQFAKRKYGWVKHMNELENIL